MMSIGVQRESLFAVVSKEKNATKKQT